MNTREKDMSWCLSNAVVPITCWLMHDTAHDHAVTFKVTSSQKSTKKSLQESDRWNMSVKTDSLQNLLPVTSRPLTGLLYRSLMN